MTNSARILYGIVCGVFTTVLSVPLQAQDEQASALEEIVVTGSYLYTGIDSPSPVTVFTGEDMMFEANQDMLTFFFENVTQNYTSDIGAQTDAGGNMGARSIRQASINLRGLGNENTLVLLNGRRTINYPAPDFNGWTTPDINSMVPRIAIERTDLLLDGGSATFGSDPVAGVVNFVTKKSFRGFDLALDSRINETDTDAKDYTIAALWGAGDDRTTMIAAIEWTETDRILLSDVEGEDNPNPDVTPETGTGLDDQFGLNFDGAGRNAPTWVDPDCGNPALGVPLFAKYPSYEDVDDVLRVADAMNLATSCSQPNGYNPSQFIQNNVTQLTAFLSADHQLSDSVSVDFEINFSRQRFDDIATWGDNSSRNWLVTPVTRGITVPTTNPGFVRAATVLPQLGALPFGDGGMGAVPVFMEGETMPFNHTMPAYQRADLFRVAFGGSGDLAGTNNWQWRVDTSVAWNEVENGLRDMVVANYELAIEGYGGTTCTFDPASDPGGAQAGTGDCYYYNPFMSSALPDAASLQTGISQTGLANDPAMLEWLIPTRQDTFTGEFWSADVLITGEVGELPGGPIGIAIGAGSRHETLGRDSDYLSTSNLLAATGNYNDWEGKQNVDSIYFEVALPLRDDIDLQIAARNEKYDGGFSETTPKIAVLWTPTDQLALRASFGSSFRGPSISQSDASTLIGGFGPRRVTIDQIEYGANGRGWRFPFLTVPNANLLPQTSDNISLGFDYQINDRIDIGATWVSISFKDRIGAAPAPTTLNNAACLNLDDAGIPILFGGELTYLTIANGGCVSPADPALPVTGANIGYVQSVVSNLNYLDAEFLDLRLAIRADTPIGPLSFTPSVSITTKYEFPNTDGAIPSNDFLCPDDICDGVGRAYGGGMGQGFVGVTEMPRWQGTFPVRLTIGGNHNVSFSARYRDGINRDIRDLTPDQLVGFEHESGQWSTSVNYNYGFTNGASVAFAISNLTVTDPPNQAGARFNRRSRTYNLQYRHTFEQ